MTRYLFRVTANGRDHTVEWQGSPDPLVAAREYVECHAGHSVYAWRHAPGPSITTLGHAGRVLD